ncbi:glycoside hydrolase family 13 protein [Polaribacter sp. R2A056_3_33]|uniref:glycoside hydrolase family 13 protein n=1 Tax=Polaribacter sp. R2A056_3_33 TaxID=2745563 RepID=UPI001C4F9A42|nr:glycoside hydrolase family 13 protein [Polaribacter sp. R2A056_3_33]QXP69734.1 glycoside hydrolase family 13 protein [Polaribacter sp. R2A056_3_33]
MKNLFLIFVIVFLFSCQKREQNKMEVTKEITVVINEIERVEPPNWFVGFKDTSLQLLVKEENIGDAIPSISYEGVTLEKVNKARSNNYLFIDLKIDASTKAGKVNIDFTFTDGTKKTHTYELKLRDKKSDDFIGFNSSDAIYLITPDRFANGDDSNNINTALKETDIDRSDNYKRHGGDIQGIINHIDYILDLGFTTVWPTPVLLNDMAESSYHGYAITDYYKVDSRFGNLSEYKELADKLRKKDMKLIMDQVANHCGIGHWWMEDLPFGDWLNNQKNYEENIDNWNNETNIGSNHRRTTNQDIYVSKADLKGNNEGWFTPAMPDLNQRNPFLAKYIIQNSIWWIETLGLGGIRQDTYPYPDKNFMSDWAGAIMHEYPNFSIVGEEWSYNPLIVGYWQKGANNRDGYESNLKSPMDFPMQKFIVEGINEEESWDKGLIKLYEGLANDFHYASPKDVFIFLDNHDKTRVFTELWEDTSKVKMGLSYMLTLPRIPQIYYGTEILMNDSANPGDHGLIRSDFPGGFKDDAVNAFTGEGLNEYQKDMQSFVTKVLNYRKESKAIHDGKTIHFAPFMGTYFLFRTKDDETVVNIINKNDQPITIDLKRFEEVGLEGKTLKNIITGDTFIWGNEIHLSEKGSVLLTTKI